MKFTYALATICLLLAACEPDRGISLPTDKHRDDNTFSIGKRTGTLVKLSRKGWSHKPSFEGQMVMGGTVEKSVDGGTAAVPYVWAFSIGDQDAEVAKDVDKAIIEGCRVVVVYQQLKLQTDQWADTDYRLKAVLRIDNGVLKYMSGGLYKENDQGLPEGTPMLEEQ